jgi:tetratricopeptide (TPR) repeat protein
MRIRSLILAACVVLAAPMASADMASANDAFRAGRYDAALVEASAAGPSADAYALKARATLAKTMCSSLEPDPARIREALASADAALTLDPRHGEGRLQKAIALSLLTRPMSLGEANRSGYGPEAKALAEAVLSDDPANHYALGFLAVWHVEVHRRGGTLGAAMLGASLKTAGADYAEAIRLAPDDAGLRWQWARALAAFDAKKYRSQIESELEAALAIDPQTDLDRVMQKRAETLLNELTSKRARDVEDIANRMH